MLKFIEYYFKKYQHTVVFLSGLVVLVIIIQLISFNFIVFTYAQNHTIQFTTNNQTLPVDGYDESPPGPLTAVRHVFDDPNLRVYHFCKPNDKIMMVCQLYDSSSPNATLIGVEYMIDSKTYGSLPDREKPNWHYHKEEFSPMRANPIFPLLNDTQQEQWLVKMSNSYGKVILNWNPLDKLPIYPSQIQQVQHPFMTNKTLDNSTEKYVGSFNQTLEY